MNNNEWQLIIKKLENELKQKVYQFPNLCSIFSIQKANWEPLGEK